VRLLIDENLSPRLSRRIDDLFPESVHVRSVGLKQKPDVEIWEFAKSDGFAILTSDGDFHEIAGSFGHPPKVIYIKGCNFGTTAVESLIRSQAIRIADFLLNKDSSVLILRRA
jgi:predicted nuclease of predicted toxin-antitoxin system